MPLIVRIGFSRDRLQNPFQYLMKRPSELPDIHQDSVLRHLKKKLYFEHNLE